MADEFDLWRVIGTLAGADDHLADQRTRRLQDLWRVAALDGLAQHGDPPGIEFGEVGVQGGRGGRFLLEGGEQLALPCLQFLQLALPPGRADTFGDGVDEVLELPLHHLKLPPAARSGGRSFGLDLVPLCDERAAESRDVLRPHQPCPERLHHHAFEHGPTDAAVVGAAASAPRH